MDPSNDEDPQDLSIQSNGLDRAVYALWKINVVNLIQVKASLAKNLHVQPSEIDNMPMWEYEIFLQELNDQVQEENKQQQSEMDKYHVKDYMDAANPKNMQKSMGGMSPKMPSFSNIKLK